MNLLLGLLIVTTLPDSAHAGRHPDAVEVFHCTFDKPWDANFDAWPDRWIRKTGREYPPYLKIGIEQEPTADGGRCLKIELDGGAATVFSPPIQVDARFSYVLDAKLQTGGLVHNVAYLSCTFYDAERKALETVYSVHRTDAPEWKEMRIGPFSPSHQASEIAILGLHLMPTEKQDLRGWARFDNVWFARLPRMSLQTNSPYNVYTDPNDVRVSCTLSGILERDPVIKFELLDASSNSIARTAQRLDGEIIAQKSSKASDLLGTAANKPAGYEGTTEWQPPLVASGENADNAYGFYRVRVTMNSPNGIMHEREISLAVIRPLDKVARGEFGWSLPAGDQPLSFDALSGLLPHVGIHWLKFPVWYDESNPRRGEQIMLFAERLGAHDIEMVGLLDNPPRAVLHNLGSLGEQVSAANVFSANPKLWFASLDPVLTRLSLKIRWWQLGGDHDTSFVGYPDLYKKIAEVKKRLYRFGQETHLGIGWSWIAEQLPEENPPWEFLSLSANPPLTGAEIATYLDTDNPPRSKRWALVEPLPRSHYAMDVRARDLVDQMMWAKIEQAEGVFVPNPFSTEHGLMNDDGTPGELLLPWRTTALTLGGATYLGSIRMPQGSHNHIFTRNGEAVMVVWSEKPVKEVIYLGDEVRQIDIWGRMAKPPHPTEEEESHNQIISVGPLPTFITGVNEQVARWRMAVKFEHERMPSIFGQTHRNGVSMKNTFNQGGGGEITLVTPNVWTVYPQKMNFKLAVGEEHVKPFEVKLPFTASSGLQEVRIDFNINVDRRYKFSAYRDLGIGLGDVVIEVNTKFDEEGTLIVEQRMTNHSDQIVDFKCLLHAPDRRRQSNQVFRLGRGEDVKVYYYPNAADLLGEQLWLRAEEIDGQRILNYRFMVRE